MKTPLKSTNVAAKPVAIATEQSTPVETEVTTKALTVGQADQRAAQTIGGDAPATKSVDALTNTHLGVAMLQLYNVAERMEKTADFFDSDFLRPTDFGFTGTDDPRLVRKAAGQLRAAASQLESVSTSAEIPRAVADENVAPGLHKLRASYARLVRALGRQQGAIAEASKVDASNAPDLGPIASAVEWLRSLHTPLAKEAKSMLESSVKLFKAGGAMLALSTDKPGMDATPPISIAMFRLRSREVAGDNSYQFLREAKAKVDDGAPLTRPERARLGQIEGKLLSQLDGWFAAAPNDDGPSGIYLAGKLAELNAIMGVEADPTLTAKAHESAVDKRVQLVEDVVANGDVEHAYLASRASSDLPQLMERIKQSGVEVTPRTYQRAAALYDVLPAGLALNKARVGDDHKITSDMLGQALLGSEWKPITGEKKKRSDLMSELRSSKPNEVIARKASGELEARGLSPKDVGDSLLSSFCSEIGSRLWDIRGVVRSDNPLRADVGIAKLNEIQALLELGAEHGVDLKYGKETYSIHFRELNDTEDLAATLQAMQSRRPAIEQALAGG